MERKYQTLMPIGTSPSVKNPPTYHATKNLPLSWPMRCQASAGAMRASSHITTVNTRNAKNASPTTTSNGFDPSLCASAQCTLTTGSSGYRNTGLSGGESTPAESHRRTGQALVPAPSVMCKHENVAKYDALAAHLDQLSKSQETVTLSFAQVAEIVGGLPQSAYEIRQWWANDSKVEARAWRSVGWHVAEGGVDFSAETVRFARGKVGGTRARRLGLE